MRPDVHTIGEVAERFGVTSQTIHRWLRRGDLPFLRIGGRRYIPRKPIDRMLDPELATPDPA